MDMNDKTQNIKNNIVQLDWILKGTVTKRYTRCGKINCRCIGNDKKNWHGPYFVWTRKEKGKTITKTLSKEQAKQIQKAFQNMKKLNQYLEKWKKVSLDNLTRYS